MVRQCAWLVIKFVDKEPVMMRRDNNAKQQFYYRWDCKLECDNFGYFATGDWSDTNFILVQEHALQLRSDLSLKMLGTLKNSRTSGKTQLILINQDSVKFVSKISTLKRSSLQRISRKNPINIVFPHLVSSKFGHFQGLSLAQQRSYTDTWPFLRTQKL